MKTTEKEIDNFVKSANKIVVVQADNPDADSLGSALALEQILHQLGKEPFLYCGVNIPQYLRYLPGWDRVMGDLPTNFDAAIIVDTSADSLFESLNKSGQKGWLSAKPTLIIDHHATEPTISFAKLKWIKEAVSTGEIIYELAAKLKWPINDLTAELLAASILSDSMGLSSEATTARSIHVLAELVEKGAKLARLESRRREFSRKTRGILAYKAELLKRIEYSADGRVAILTVPWAEIEKYSHDYNPAMLAMDDMRSVEGVEGVIVFKLYKDSKITAKIRTNYGFGIAKDLAEHFGGGGHAFASGFKITDGSSYQKIKKDTLDQATKLLDNLPKGKQ